MDQPVRWWEALGSAWARWIPEHLSWFQQDWFGPLMSGVLLALGVIAAAVLLLRVRHYGSRLRQARAHIEATATAEQFAAQFGDLGKKIGRTRFLAHPWIEYSETLIPPDSTAQPPTLRFQNTERPAAFFNPVEARLQMPVMRSLPGVFVGVGLLLTFVGLVVALGTAAQGFAGGQTSSEIEQALEHLLTVAGTKFYASIAGLVCSLGLSVVEKKAAAYLDERFAEFCEALERKVDFISFQHLSAKALVELRRQSRSLEQFSTELAVTIGKHLSEALGSMPKLLQDAVEPMAKEIRTVAQSMSSQNVGAIDQMGKAFADRVEGMSRQSFDRVTAQLETLSVTLSGLGQSLAGGGEQMRQEMTTAVASLVGSLGEIRSEILKATGQAGDTLSAGGAKAAEDIAKAVQSLREAGERSAEQMAALTSTIAASSDAAARAASEAVAAAGESAAAEVSSAARAIGSQLSTVGDQAAATIAEWQAALEGTNRQLNELGSALAGHRDAIERAAVGTRDGGESMQKAAAILRDASAPLADATRQIASASVATSDLLRSVKTDLDGISTDIRGASDAVSASQRELVSVWESHSRHLAGADAQLELAFEKVTAALTNNLKLLQDFVNGVDQNLSVSVQSLGAGIDGLREFAEDVRDVVERSEKIAQSTAVGR